jgi:hypothetical protein
LVYFKRESLSFARKETLQPEKKVETTFSLCPAADGNAPITLTTDPSTRGIYSTQAGNLLRDRDLATEPVRLPVPTHIYFCSLGALAGGRLVIEYIMSLYFTGQSSNNTTQTQQKFSVIHQILQDTIAS